MSFSSNYVQMVSGKRVEPGASWSLHGEVIRPFSGFIVCRSAESFDVEISVGGHEVFTFEGYSSYHEAKTKSLAQLEAAVASVIGAEIRRSLEKE